MSEFINKEKVIQKAYTFTGSCLSQPILAGEIDGINTNYVIISKGQKKKLKSKKGQLVVFLFIAGNGCIEFESQQFVFHNIAVFVPGLSVTFSLMALDKDLSYLEIALVLKSSDKKECQKFKSQYPYFRKYSDCKTYKENIKSDSFIKGNSTQVYQVLMNLCTNATHAMETTGGVLELELRDVMIDKKDCIEIKVSDTGVGIAPEIIGSVFEPYFTTKGPGAGTGLGLAMAQGVIENYGGKITVDSQLGKGTIFSIYLPITKKGSTHGAYVPEPLPSGKGRILFVDDELPIVKMGSQILERLGYSVTTRTSSVEALELFRAKPNDFEMVITDMTMPNLNGDELAVELIRIRPDIPILLCTGYSKRITDETALNIGIKAFVYKPVVKADLAKTVRKVLDEARIS